MSAARREIERYRTDDGLYRTWLADEATHRCFYTPLRGKSSRIRRMSPSRCTSTCSSPGMIRPPPGGSARPCGAAWMTIASGCGIRSPLCSRCCASPDLARKGCSLRVPESRVERAVPGQEPYMTEARLLNSLLVERSSCPLARPVSAGPPRDGRGRLRQHVLDTAAPVSQQPVGLPAALSLVGRLRLRAVAPALRRDGAPVERKPAAAGWVSQESVRRASPGAAFVHVEADEASDPDQLDRDDVLVRAEPIRSDRRPSRWPNRFPSTSPTPPSASAGPVAPLERQVRAVAHRCAGEPRTEPTPRGLRRPSRHPRAAGHELFRGRRVSPPPGPRERGLTRAR